MVKNSEGDVFMIYEFMRTMAGPGICKLSDYYMEYQTVFNFIIVVAGFSWTIYKKKSNVKN